MTRAAPALAAVLALCLVWGTAWSGALDPLVPGPFTAHMVAHVTVMSLAAPLFAVALAGSRHDPARRWPLLAAPLPAMLAELVVVWGWHVPLLHAAARAQPAVLVAEQASFLAVGLLLWLSVLGGGERNRRSRRAGGIIALLLTSMHMTLLGALITLAPRALYHHPPLAGLADLADQQVAGMVMLFGGATSYLAGGLWLMRDLLRGEETHAPLG